jgi:hypothetical protein
VFFVKLFLRKLFGGQGTARPTARPARPVRLGLECLDDRLLPSITATGAAFDVTGSSTPGQYATPDEATARAGNGRFAMTWAGDGAYGSGIYARLFDASGAALTGPTRIVGTSSGKDFGPTIAMSDNGQFAAAWTHQFSSTDQDVYVQRFDANGSPLGGLIMAASTARNEHEPSAAMDANGNLVVAYTYDYSATDRDVYAWYRQAGGAQGRFAVATSAWDESRASTALNDSGQGVIAYTSHPNAGWSPDGNIYAQRINAQGYTVGSAIPAATSNLDEDDASAAIDNDGNFVVAFTRIEWESLDLGDHHWKSAQVLANRFRAPGASLGEVAVGDAADTRFEYEPSVALDNHDNFVIAYTHAYSSTDRDVLAQEFSFSWGAAQGGAV